MKLMAVRRVQIMQTGKSDVPLPPAPPPANPKPTALPAAPQWPGMNLEWPKLMPFGQSPNTPPPGPGGGRLDPFKRARPAQQDVP